MKNVHLNVIKYRLFWWWVSTIAMILSIVLMVVSYTQFQAPLKPSLDFVGGTRLQMALDCSVANACDQPLTTAPIQALLEEQQLKGSSVQILGKEKTVLSIRTQDLTVDQRTTLQEALNEKIGKFDPKTIQIDTVGPSIGKELFTQGMLALLLSFFGIIVYLTFRFQLDYAFFAIFALFHDTVVTAGIFAGLGLVAGIEVDSLFLVALLTIVGFSVNDTVVIYDRIREDIERRPDDAIDDIVDLAVNQTLGRSINTTLTVLLPLVSIFFFGGETLKYFALALIFGFVFGAYSSIFIASTLLAWWRNFRKKQMDVAIASIEDS